MRSTIPLMAAAVGAAAFGIYSVINSPYSTYQGTVVSGLMGQYFEFRTPEETRQVDAGVMCPRSALERLVREGAELRITVGERNGGWYVEACPRRVS